MSTKTRRPVAMSTPKKQVPKTPSRREASKQAVLDNYDLEVSHRTATKRAELDSMLSTFLAVVEAEILKIPRDMRTMTLGELESHWAGSFAETSRALAEKRFERIAPATDEEAVLAAAKRKRAAQSPLPLEKMTKNPRTKKPAPAPKRRVKKVAKKAPLPADTSASGLPQDHEFNPRLPQTPARAPRRNESFFSQNGSPVNLELQSESSGSEDEDDDDVGDLPDPKAMEAAAERSSAASRSTSNSRGKSKSKPKRGPSLVFRQSLAAPLGDAPELAGKKLVDIPLADGRTISFNPLALSPERIDAELESGGLGAKQKASVQKMVQDEVLRSLTERMERWRALN